MYGLGAISTLIAAAVGTLLGLIAMLPLSLVFVFIFPMLLYPFVVAIVLAAPITLLLFPVTAMLLRDRPILAQIAIPLLGAAGGYAIIPGWSALGIPAWITLGALHPNDQQLFSAIGMISGFCGAGFFVRGRFA